MYKNVSTEFQTYCIPCEAGTYANQAASSICTDCSPGTYASTKNKSTCDPCPINFFTNVSQTVQCKKCPAGTDTRSLQGAPECTPCSPGYFSPAEASSCQVCPINQYTSKNGTVTCEKCPAGSDTLSKTASISPENCTLCRPGYFSPVNGSSCQACPVNQFNDVTGSLSCQACPAGYDTAGKSASVACTPCNAGFYSPLNGSSCQGCPAGSISDQPAQTSCSLCAQGTYNPSVAQTVCQRCNAGSYAESSGSSVCNLCPAGTASPVVGSFNSTDCRQCSAGTYSPGQGYSVCQGCITCGRSQTSSLETFKTAPCSATVDYPCQECNRCQPDTYMTERCSATSDSTCQQCTSCQAGSYVSSGCTDGYTPWLNYEQFMACLRRCGIYSPPCLEACRNDFYRYNGLDSSCSLCPPGTFSNTSNLNTKCQPCPAGSYQPSAGSTSCVLASPGYFVFGIGQADQTPCEPGSFTEVNGTVNCTLCEIGYASDKVGADNRSTCEVCENGTTFSDKPGLAVCKPCTQCTGWQFEDPETFAVINAGNYLVGECSYDRDTRCQNCTNCNANGTYFFKDYCSNVQDSNCSLCSMCEPGFYLNNVCQGYLDTECYPCARGSIMPGANLNRSCVLCSPGTFARFLAQTACDDAPAGLPHFALFCFSMH